MVATLVVNECSRHFDLRNRPFTEFRSLLTLHRRRNVTLLRTLGSRRLRQLRPKGAALGLNEGYHVATARSGGPITPKRCDFRGVRFRSITWVTVPRGSTGTVGFIKDESCMQYILTPAYRGVLILAVSAKLANQLKQR